MWLLILAVVVAVLICFSFVLLVGAPYLPTLTPQIKISLDLVALKQGQTLLELGSGDGRVLFAAAEQGIRAVGYELNPLLVLYTKIRAYKYKGLVEVRWGNFWHKQWPQANGIFSFQLEKYMNRLDKKIVHEYPGQKIKLVSFAFKVPNKKPVKSEGGVFLYEYK